MLSEKKINEILDGCAFLDGGRGTLYEYVGKKDDRFIFEALQGKGKLRLTYKELRKDECFDIAY